MAKTRELHWKPPQTKRCTQCEGLGIIRGLFSSGPCAQCDGAGVTGTNDEALPHEDAVAILRQKLELARTKYKQLLNTPGVREALKEERRRQHQKALGYGTDKYQGD